MSETIYIDRYDTEIEHGKIVYYAVKGKTKYPIPEAYSRYCTNDYLAIRERTVDYPDLDNVPATHYIPLRTA